MAFRGGLVRVTASLRCSLLQPGTRWGESRGLLNGLTSLSRLADVKCPFVSTDSPPFSHWEQPGRPWTRGFSNAPLPDEAAEGQSRDGAELSLSQAAVPPPPQLSVNRRTLEALQYYRSNRDVDQQRKKHKKRMARRELDAAEQRFVAYTQQAAATARKHYGRMHRARVWGGKWREWRKAKAASEGGQGAAAPPREAT